MQAEQEFEEGKRKREEDEKDVQADRKKPKHKDDLKPWTTDMFAHLTAEDIPEVMDHQVTYDNHLPPEARKCPIPVRRMIHNAHRNLGHPSNAALVRLMSTAKCHIDAINYARHMTCPTCVRRKPPDRMPRVSMPYRPTRFNAVVGLDLKWVYDKAGTTYYLLNILDLATTFNVCVPLLDKKPETVANAFKTHWYQWANVPEKVVADKGRENYGELLESMANLGIQYKLIPTEAPWQLGMVERHGGVLGDIIKATVNETSAVGHHQMRDVCLYASMAKNRRPGKTGYSPRTLVFGVDEKLVASGLSHYLEEPDDADVRHSREDPHARKSMEIRAAAMTAVIELDHSTKWAQAIKFPSRTEKTMVSLFLPGQQVFFWKKASNKQQKKHDQQVEDNKTKGLPPNPDLTQPDPGNPAKGRRARMPERWHPLYGPAVVIGHEWDNKHMSDSYWVSYGGMCVLVPGVHMRHAEIEELMADDKYFKELKKALDLFSKPELRDANLTEDLDPERAQQNSSGKLKPLSTRSNDVGGLQYMQSMFDERPVPVQVPNLDSTMRQSGSLTSDRGLIPGQMHTRTSRVPSHGSTRGSVGSLPPATETEEDLLPEGSVPTTDHLKSSEHSDEKEAKQSSKSAPSLDGSVIGSSLGLSNSKASIPRGVQPEPVMLLTPLEMRNLKSVANAPPGREDVICYLKHQDKTLVFNMETNQVLLLKWKTFKKNQRKGKELDAKWFDRKERQAFAVSDDKEWQSFLETGAVSIIPPNQVSQIPGDRIFSMPFRFIRTNKDKSGDDLIAKSRIVTPGHVDPDGDVPIEHGGFRTDAPTASQLAFHMLCSSAVRKKWKLRSFDCKTAFLTGEAHNRELYVRPPREGLPGVPPGSLIKLIKGAYGLGEAPRLWYLKIRAMILDSGFTEMRTSKGAFVVRDSDGNTCGMLIIHVDDACFAGAGEAYDKAIESLRQKVKIGTEDEQEFDFLGRHVKQLDDYTIEIDQHTYVKNIERVKQCKDRMTKDKNQKLDAKEMNQFRSLVGQLAWPARESMPQLAYAVSDLQQRTSEATVHDLSHANRVLGLAKKWASDHKQKLIFRPLAVTETLHVDLVHVSKPVRDADYKFLKKHHPILVCPSKDEPPSLGVSAVHDASFMQQPRDGSQTGYAIMIGSTNLYDSETLRSGNGLGTKGSPKVEHG